MILRVVGLAVRMMRVARSLPDDGTLLWDTCCTVLLYFLGMPYDKSSLHELYNIQYIQEYIHYIWSNLIFDYFTYKYGGDFLIFLYYPSSTEIIYSNRDLNLYNRISYKYLKFYQRPYF